MLVHGVPFRTWGKETGPARGGTWGGKREGKDRSYARDTQYSSTWMRSWTFHILFITLEMKGKARGGYARRGMVPAGNEWLSRRRPPPTPTRAQGLIPAPTCEYSGYRHPVHVPSASHWASIPRRGTWRGCSRYSSWRGEPPSGRRGVDEEAVEGKNRARIQVKRVILSRK